MRRDNRVGFQIVLKLKLSEFEVYIRNNISLKFQAKSMYNVQVLSNLKSGKIRLGAPQSPTK